MSEQDNLRVARQGFDAWNAHDSDSFVKLIADDSASESDTLPTPLRGPRWRASVDADVHQGVS